ncbi:MAG: dipeptidase [Coriobacteriia bacterium]|nr:dipeptidase [Coriobacteriia bacterium]
MRVFDLHCDTLDRLCLNDYAAYPDFAQQNAKEGIPKERLASLRDNDAHVSLERMEAQAWCQCFAIFIPDALPPKEGWKLFKHVNAYFTEQMLAHGDLVWQVRSACGIDGALAAGKCAALLTVEGASFLVDSLKRIDELAQAGVQMLTLTWNAQNALASGSEAQGGISAFGKAAISALEERHIIIDASHLNSESLTDLLRCAQRPFVASHSNARSICTHQRNLSDYQFQAITERGGIVGLNLYTGFLIDEKREPTPADVLRHIEHWLKLGGQDAIALGSDYDGADVPLWLKGCEKLGSLYEHVSAHFGSDLADRFFFTNAYTFFKDALIESVAAENQ